MGTAAGKLGVVVGTVSQPIVSPDVIYDIKERIHRTPYIRNSAVPSPARLSQANEQRLMTLTNGTVVRLQTKQKDGTKGINLYKRGLKSVPRELFDHPLAEDVEWLNLACNALVYNKNGLFKDIDKVESHGKSDDEESDSGSVLSSKKSRTSSKSRSSSKNSKKSGSHAPLASSTANKSENELHGGAGDSEEDLDLVDQGTDIKQSTSPVAELETSVEKELSPKPVGDNNADSKSGSSISTVKADASPNSSKTLPEELKGSAKESSPTEDVDKKQTVVEGNVPIDGNEDNVENKTTEKKDTNDTGANENEKSVEKGSDLVEEENVIQLKQDIAVAAIIKDKDIVKQTVGENVVNEHDIEKDTTGAVVTKNDTAKKDVDEKDEVTTEVIPEVAPAENSTVEKDAVETDLDTEDPVPEVAPAESVVHKDASALKIKPGDLIPEDVTSELDLCQQESHKTTHGDVKKEDAKESVKKVVGFKDNGEDKSPVEGDTNVEDYLDAATVKTIPRRSVAETVNISDFEEESEDEEKKVEDEVFVKDEAVDPSEKVESKEETNSASSSSSSSSDSDASDDDDKEEEEYEEVELMSDEEGELLDKEGNVILRPKNTLCNRFQNMPNLIELHLGYYGKGNPLKTIPPSIYSLQHLQKLDASSCRLTELPPEVSMLSSLEELWLSGNFLRTLPKSLGDLKKLKSLWVNYNQLTGIPPTLEFCDSLEGLYAHGNEIEFLSTALCRIPKLAYLGVGRNRIKFLPKNIGNLEMLKEAWLNDNELRELPDSLFELKSLKTLWLSNNKMLELDKKVGELSLLAELSLSKNRLTSLPPSLSKCSNLRVLQLDDNKLVALPKSLSSLPHLEELWLNGNAVKEIPEGLYMLSNMRKPL